MRASYTQVHQMRGIAVELEDYLSREFMLQRASLDGPNSLAVYMRCALGLCAKQHHAATRA